MKNILLVFFMLSLSFTSCKDGAEKENTESEETATVVESERAKLNEDEPMLENEDESRSAAVEVDMSGFHEEAASSTRTSSSSSMNTKGRYYIVVGSFMDTYYAEEFEKSLKNKGIDCFIVSKDPYSSYHHVAVGAYDTQGEAYSKLAEVRETIPNCWVY